MSPVVCQKASKPILIPGALRKSDEEDDDGFPTSIVPCGPSRHFRMGGKEFTVGVDVHGQDLFSEYLEESLRGAAKSSPIAVKQAKTPTRKPRMMMGAHSPVTVPSTFRRRSDSCSSSNNVIDVRKKYTVIALVKRLGLDGTFMSTVGAVDDICRALGGKALAEADHYVINGDDWSKLKSSLAMRGFELWNHYDSSALPKPVSAPKSKYKGSRSSPIAIGIKR